jgi:ParB/RepB/Spo0J family partition protein
LKPNRECSSRKKIYQILDVDGREITPDELVDKYFSNPECCFKLAEDAMQRRKDWNNALFGGSLEVKISHIKMVNRFRKDLGDIDRLAKSIEEVGLLHPVVITENNELVCGRRRIEAFLKLHKTEIEATILSLKLENLARAETEENTVREDFIPAEIAEIDEFYREEEQSAIIRKKAGKHSEIFAKGRSSAKIAAIVGVSDRTVEKIRSLKESAASYPAIYGTYWYKVNSQTMSIDRAYKKLKQHIRKEETRKAAHAQLSSQNSSDEIDLRLGDMREVGKATADGSIDLIFTDPPYKRGYLYLYGELAKLSQRVLKSGGSLVTFIGHYALFEIGKLIAENSQLQYHWQLIVKHNGRTARMWKQRVWPKYKPMLWYYKPREGQNGPTMFSDIDDLIESEAPGKLTHPWEQSTIEVKHMITPLTVEGMTVLDPFMGSGTTGIAALRL